MANTENDPMAENDLAMETTVALLEQLDNAKVTTNGKTVTVLDYYTGTRYVLTVRDDGPLTDEEWAEFRRDTGTETISGKAAATIDPTPAPQTRVCHAEKHDIPCPAPCQACAEECDPALTY
jgi:chitodextrinase